MCGILLNSGSPSAMSLELSSACNFLVHLIRLSGQSEAMSESHMDRFRTNLTEVLSRRYRDHWFPERPFKGSGYRCIRINGNLDPVLSQAADESAISTKLLRKSFPSELTMWIDPKEVSYRIGENGSICVLYEYKGLSQQPWAPSLSNSIESSASSKVNKQAAANTTASSSASSSSSNASTPSSSSSSTNVTSSSNSSISSSSSLSSSPSSSGGSLSPPNNPPSCGKESLRNIDYLLDPRRSTLSSMEQLTAYVSS
eukprot:TRINITY_DN605_c0_g1_i1.p1 TRINITY_DN605_c0_g1~~TRINITY_DN605_c0_g1_i1.p1  ORF type:complete len:256 (+),score=130.43 TRINITY_DN605_c0_g1_i1:267-1034(+)